MFDMSKIGRNIARLRKEAGLTQMGLADAMGISFQAVSNWERGQTMPDISKLPELASILGVTVDGLLGADEAKVVERAVSETDEPLTVQELADVAPLLPPAEAKRNFERTKEETESSGRRLRLSDLVELAPFLDEDDLGELVMEAVEGGCELSELASVAPFMDEDDVGRAANRAIELGADPTDLASLAPFMDEDDVGEAARAMLDAGGVPGDIAAIAPFMDRDDIGDIAREYIERGGSPSELAAIAPFLDSDDLGDIARDYVKNGGETSELMGILPFIRRGINISFGRTNFHFGLGKNRKKRGGED